MVFADPELVKTEGVQMGGQTDVMAHLEHGMLADGMVRGEKGPEFHARHKGSPELTAKINSRTIAQASDLSPGNFAS